MGSSGLHKCLLKLSDCGLSGFGGAGFHAPETFAKALV